MKMDSMEKYGETSMEDEMMHDMHKAKHKGSKEHKVMTMEDVAEHLKEGFEDEIEDSKKYYCMARVAEKAHNEEDHHYLMEMAKDEYTHAYFIHKFMQEHGMMLPEEQVKEFTEWQEKMQEFFR